MLKHVSCVPADLWTQTNDCVLIVVKDSEALFSRSRDSHSQLCVAFYFLIVHKSVYVGYCRNPNIPLLGGLLPVSYQRRCSRSILSCLLLVQARLLSAPSERLVVVCVQSLRGQSLCLRVQIKRRSLVGWRWRVQHDELSRVAAARDLLPTGRR